MANPRAAGAIIGFAGTAALVSVDAAPFVEHSGRLLIGISGFVLVGVVAGLLANERRAWSALVAGVLSAAVLYLVARRMFIFTTGPSLTPVDEWRLWLFLSLVATVAIASVGLAIGRLARGWRPKGPLGRLAMPAIRVGAVSMVAAGAIAFYAATTGLVLSGDSRTLTIRVTDAGIELSPPQIEEGMYVIVHESAVSRPLSLTLVGAMTLSSGVNVSGMSRAEAEAFFDGGWLTAAAAPYRVEGQYSLEPGRRYSGEWMFVAGSRGNTVIWYTSEQGQTIPVPQGLLPPDTLPEEGIAEFPWPPDARAIMTVGAP